MPLSFPPAQIANLRQPVSCPSTLIVHGTKATGKSTTTKAVLEFLEVPFAIIRSQECITTRHLLERTIAAVQKACTHEKLGDVAQYAADGRCENISAFVVLLQKTLPSVGKFILVFDGIDRQRDASPTLLPAIARLGELVPLPVFCKRARLTSADTKPECPINRHVSSTPTPPSVRHPLYTFSSLYKGGSATDCFPIPPLTLPSHVRSHTQRARRRRFSMALVSLLRCSLGLPWPRCSTRHHQLPLRLLPALETLYGTHSQGRLRRARILKTHGPQSDVIPK